jgi:hypothetical protein
MKRGLGGLLSLALGVVLIVNGGLDASDSGAGAFVPTCQPVFNVGVDPATSCPLGTVTVAEATHQASAQTRRADAAPTPPGTWHEHLTSDNCTAATPTSAREDETLDVPDNGSAASASLFVYTDATHTVFCSYRLAQQEVIAGVTTTYSVSMPFTLPDNGARGNDVTVTVTNAFRAAASPTPTPTVTPSATTSAPVSSAPVTSAPVTSSTPASSAVSATVTDTGSGVAAASGSSSAGALLASTGPKSRVDVTLFGGIALCLLGLVLLFAERLGRPARRRR